MADIDDVTATDRARDYTPAVYGSLLVTTLVAVQWRHDVSTTLLGLTLVGSVVVFWLTHVWSGIVNRRVHGPVRRPEAVGIALAEAPMLAAAIVPAAVLGLGSLTMLTVDSVVATALAVSIAQLFVWGLAVGRAAHVSPWLAVGVALVDVALGLAIVTLKVVVLH